MIHITVNGTETVLSTPITVASYLEEHNYKLTRIAVELNGSILPIARYSETVLSDSDTMEVVSFVGGG